MKNIKTVSFHRIDNTTVYLFSSVLVTLFLFYIDEGYYSFRWMTNAGAWIIFLIYVSVFLLAQLGINAILSKIISNRATRTLSLLVGILTGIIFLFLIFYQSLGK